MNIFDLKTEEEFNKACISVFNQQIKNITVYKEFVEGLKVNTNTINHYRQIPFLPIQFFKSHAIISDESKSEIAFTSSGTTGSVTSAHFVENVNLYEESYLTAFNRFYGDIADWCILALLPNYSEREGSSLIYMIDDLIQKSKHHNSGYFLHNHEDLHQTLLQLKAKKQKTLLIGVTYALLDFVEKKAIDFPKLTVMETGGMKGKRKEMVREELHQVLCAGFGIEKIHSEYGMTELLSQAYSKGDGIFDCPPWMKILIRDTNDPLTLIDNNKTGGINVIDLANNNSCSFIATQDLGKIIKNDSFEVLGRFDNSDIRGCNLLVG
jgi:phenylacetate-coenzyme A ligase PaaK-like adenylate-forming protein